MAQPPPFEIPQQLRDLTEKNLEHARSAYGQFMDAMTQAMGVWTNATPAGAMTGGFKVVQDRAVKFAKQNADACFNLATELANGPTRAYDGIKKLVMMSSNDTLESQMERETRVITEVATTKDAREGISAFVAKRKPTYVGE